jgi:thiol-disulfide isomerase/thioredoxin
MANQKLEEDKFQTVAIPFYVLYDADRNVVATFPGLTRKPEEYVSFLNTKATGGAPAVAAAGTGSFEGGPFKTVEGTALELPKGKVLVVNYWATWCIPCRQEIPEFNKMQKVMGPRGVQVVGISMDEDGAAAVKPFLKQMPMNYTVGLGQGAFEQLPITVIYDRNGNKVKRFEGFTKPEEIQAEVEKALSASSSPV